MFQKLLGSSRTWLAAATVLIAALAMSGQAQAGAKAFAVLEVTNFLAFDNATGLVLCDGAGCLTNNFTTTPTFVNNTTAAADLDGFAGISSSNPLDVALQCLGDCAGIGQNDFTQQLLGDEFSRGDANLAQGQSIISFGGAPTTGADAQTVAEVQLTSDSAGDSSGETTLAAQFTFVLAAAIDVRFDFTGSAEVEGLLNPESNVGSFADADNTFVITIKETTSQITIFSWTVGQPLILGINGFFGLNLAAIGAQPCSLNQTTSNLIPGTTTGAVCAGFFSATTGPLLAGVAYTLSIDHKSNVDALKLIPEPGTLALLGIGFMMLGAFGRKQRKQSA